MTLGTTRQEKNGFFLYYIKKKINCQISSYIPLPLGSTRARKRCVFLLMNSRTALLESVVQNFLSFGIFGARKKMSFFIIVSYYFLFVKFCPKKFYHPGCHIPPCGSATFNQKWSHMELENSNDIFNEPERRRAIVSDALVSNFQRNGVAYGGKKAN